MTDSIARQAQAWDEAADGYEGYFMPRFAPWVNATVEALATLLPDGPILVPCCGPFPEAAALVARFPERDIVGLDLSSGMVARARQRIARWPQVRAVQGNAAVLGPEWTSKCAAVVSVFGLQQLPDPGAAMREWVGALRPGGRLAVTFWPEVVEKEGPFALLDDVLSVYRPVDDSWERAAVEAVTAAGGTLERYEFLSFPITHPSVAAYFDASARSGPLRALALERGEEFIAELRGEVLRRAPAGPVRHTPRARLIVAHG